MKWISLNHCFFFSGRGKGGGLTFVYSYPFAMVSFKDL